MNIEPVRVYPREAICGECGTAMILSWHNPWELSQGGDAVYEHPSNKCEYKGKRLRATALVCAAYMEDDE
jgi:hypothetical protein